VEESAGLGVGLTILLGLSLVAAVAGRRGQSYNNPPRPATPLRVWFVSPVAEPALRDVEAEPQRRGEVPGTLLSAAKHGLLLSPIHARLVRKHWLRSWALFSYGLAGLLLVISPARPLWPVEWFARHYGAWADSSRLVSRALEAYAAKRTRAEVFAPVIALLPADAAVLGYRADDFPETSLWKPFGSRRILHIKAATRSQNCGSAASSTCW